MTESEQLLCDCGHPRRLHFEGAGPCDRADCECTACTLPELKPAEVKRCPKCEKVKPVTEFYSRTRRGRAEPQGWCKMCQIEQTATTSRPVTLPKLLRTRARHRATAELVRRHQAEFKQLQREALRVVADEAAELVEAPAAAVYTGEPVRLRSGRRQPGETPIDRIDVARCGDCARHHDRGHVCTNCGAAAPAAEPAQATA